jgi:hypothetical protein
LATESSQTEPKKKSRRFCIILAATVLLLALLIGIVIFEWSNVGQTNYGSGPVEIKVTADKPFYLQGEEVNFTIYVSNQQELPVREPSRVTYRMEKDGGEIFNTDINIDFVPDYVPSFSPHSKTLYSTRVWDQKVGSGDNWTFAEPGNYTFSVLFHGSTDYGNGGNCTFEVRPNSPS